jgi:hypothetical protein
MVIAIEPLTASRQNSCSEAFVDAGREHLGDGADFEGRRTAQRHRVARLPVIPRCNEHLPGRVGVTTLLLIGRWIFLVDARMVVDESLNARELTGRDCYLCKRQHRAGIISIRHLIFNRR